MALPEVGPKGQGHIIYSASKSERGHGWFEADVPLLDH